MEFTDRQIAKAKKYQASNLRDCGKIDVCNYASAKDIEKMSLKEFEVLMRDEMGDEGFEELVKEANNINESASADLSDRVTQVLDDYGILYGDIVDNGDGTVNIVGVDEDEWYEVVDAIKAELGLDVIVPDEDHEEFDDELIVKESLNEGAYDKDKTSYDIWFKDFDYKGTKHNYFYNLTSDEVIQCIRDYFDKQLVVLDGTDTAVFNAIAHFDGVIDDIISESEEDLKVKYKDKAYEEFVEEQREYEED